MKKYIYSQSEIPNLVLNLKEDTKDCKILAFIGPLGAGKTTLIKEFISSFGVDKNEIISPTFNYVNIYRANGNKFYHFDLYRISSVDEFLESGFDEYLYADGLTLIEWPQVIKPLLTKNVGWINIDYHGPEKRELTLDIK